MCALLAGTLWSCDDSDSKVTDASHSITAAQNEFCRIDVREKEVAGEQVQATVTLLDPAREITRVTCNDEPCTFVSGEGAEFIYEFTMPDENVVLAAETRLKEVEHHAIRVTPNQFCEITAPENAGGGKSFA